MSKNNPLGKVTVTLYNGRKRVDSLFRVSLKALIYNDRGDLLVVKEEDKSWDAPGGGMDHGDTFRDTLARELKEEIDYDGDFSMELVGIEEPMYIQIDCFQLWIAFKVDLKSPYEPKLGVDAKEIRYINPEALRDSGDFQAQIVYRLHECHGIS